MSGETRRSPAVFNMPSGVPFLPYLAEGLVNHFGDRLQDALILLPTRRAVGHMRDALADIARREGRGASLLPRMKPLADINPEEPPFEPGELIGQVSAAMPNTQRRFEMAKLVAAYHRRAEDLPLDPATALALADPLLAILDDAAMEEVRITDTDEWKKIITDSALHFQHAATLYRIIEEYWPKRLAETGLMEAQARKVRLLNLLTESWKETPPNYPVIIAGSTGTLQATAKLMACAAHLPEGMVVLPGLQMATDQNWESIDVQHPQYSLKRFLGLLKMDRDAVTDWRSFLGRPLVKGVTDFRRMVINEALVAVDKTSDWLGRIETLRTNHGPEIFTQSLEGLSLITAPNDEDEAMSIALILRETLRQPEKTAALVTPDQGLARRVQARLGRWGVQVDMSQGEPLAQTLVGTFLLAIIDLAKDPDGPVEISVLMNHPLCALPNKSDWTALEKSIFRGLRPQFKDGEVPELITQLNQAMSPLLELTGTARPNVWAAALTAAAEVISGAPLALWGSEAGAQTSQVLEGLIAHGADLPETHSEGIVRLLHRMMQRAIVPQSGGNQVRLSILGPLEARLISADVIILGGLNEGTWPASPAVDPFLSRAMRREMELSLPERRYGLSAHDFAELAANPCVYLTRSQRSDSGPTVASRWIWRLQTLLQGAIGEANMRAGLATGDTYLRAAQTLDRVDSADVAPASPPNPAPPVAQRWGFKDGKPLGPDRVRGLSITKIQTWIRDPYAIYAQHALGLKRLENLDQAHDARHFGMAIHKAIETFLDANAAPFSDSLIPEFITHADAAFAEQGYAPELIAHERGRFEAIGRELIIWLQERTALGYDIVGKEVYAKYIFKDLNFQLSGIADLIERGPEGYAFIDFKTGTPASAKTVDIGFDPQLPLAAFLAQQGAFEGQPAGPVRQLGYVRVKGSNNGFSEAFVSGPEGKVDRKPARDASELAAEAADILRKLIQEFDRESTPYPSQPRAQYQNKYGDFDHLARRAEWRGLIDGEDGS